MVKKQSSLIIYTFTLSFVKNATDFISILAVVLTDSEWLECSHCCPGSDALSIHGMSACMETPNTKPTVSHINN